MGHGWHLQNNYNVCETRDSYYVVKKIEIKKLRYALRMLYIIPRCIILHSVLKESTYTLSITVQEVSKMVY